MNLDRFCSSECIEPLRSRPDGCVGLEPPTIEFFITSSCSKNSDGNYCSILTRLPTGMELVNTTSRMCGLDGGLGLCSTNCINVLTNTTELLGCCSSQIVAIRSISSICGVTIPQACPIVITSVDPTDITSNATGPTDSVGETDPVSPTSDDPTDVTSSGTDPTDVTDPVSTTSDIITDIFEPTTQPIPSGCPVYSERCSQLFQNTTSILLDDELNQRAANIYCNSPCPALSQQRPECFGSFLSIALRASGDTICIKNPKEEFCGVVTSQRQNFDLINNIGNSCFRANCSNTSGCAVASQQYLDHLGCCSGSLLESQIMRLSLNFSQLIPCYNFIRVPEPCPGECVCPPSPCSFAMFAPNCVILFNIQRVLQHLWLSLYSMGLPECLVIVSLLSSVPTRM